MPDSGFLGEDSATVLVEMGGYTVKMVYAFHVESALDDEGFEKICPTELWRISATSNGGGELAFNSPLPFTSYTLNNVNVSLDFAALTGTAVGKTEGTVITLDDGGGHGWFIGSTPESNDEFLPTSNPNEWLAKSGSDAAGKMDLLSVLYDHGHVLGINHGSDTHSVMSNELQFGVRRAASDRELTAI